jgi:hypothetical protein
MLVCAGLRHAWRKRSRKRAEAGDRISYGVIDPSAYSNQSGPSHAERMAMEGVMFRKADNNRIGGWDIVRDRLCGIEGDSNVGYGVGIPMWYVFSDVCTYHPYFTRAATRS